LLLFYNAHMLCFKVLCGKSLFTVYKAISTHNNFDVADNVKFTDEY